MADDDGDGRQHSSRPAVLGPPTLFVVWSPDATRAPHADRRTSRNPHRDRDPIDRSRPDPVVAADRFGRGDRHLPADLAAPRPVARSPTPDSGTIRHGAVPDQMTRPPAAAAQGEEADMRRGLVIMLRASLGLDACGASPASSPAIPSPTVPGRWRPRARRRRPLHHRRLPGRASRRSTSRRRAASSSCADDDESRAEVWRVRARTSATIARLPTPKGLDAGWAVWSPGRAAHRLQRRP